MIRIPLNIQRFADGKVVIDTDLNKKGFESGLDKIQSIAKTGFKGVATSVGVAATAITALVGKSVKAAGELEQQVGGAEAVFKSLGSTIEDIKFTSFQDAEGQVMSLKDVANDAYKTMGLSANDYLATINKMGALMQGSGLDTQKAMDLSGQAMQRAADVASIMGIDINSAMESIAGAAKGNFTMMDNLGVAMNATTIEAYALSKGINKSYNEMTNAEKVELAMQMFLEKTQKMAGNYARENETFAGSFQTLKASISNFLSGASDIEPVIESIMSFSSILIKSIGEMTPKIVDGIVQLINTLAPELPKLIEQLLPSVINGAISLVNGLVAALPQLISVLAQMLPQIVSSLTKGLVDIVNQLANMMPTLIPQIVNAILDIIPALLDNLPLLVDAGINLLLGLTEGLIEAIPLLIERLPEIITSLIAGLLTALPKLYSVGPKIIIALAKGLINSIPTLVLQTPKMIKAIVDGLVKGVSGMLNVGKQLMQGLWKGISGMKDWVINKVKDIGKSILKGLKGILGIHSPSKEFAIIGKYSIMGYEEGLEDMQRSLDKTLEDTMGLDFLKNGSVSVSSNYGSIATPSIQNQNIINLEANMDVNKFGQVFVNDIKTFSGGSKQSYNY